VKGTAGCKKELEKVWWDPEEKKEVIHAWVKEVTHLEKKVPPVSKKERKKKKQNGGGKASPVHAKKGGKPMSLSGRSNGPSNGQKVKKKAEKVCPQPLGKKRNEV